MSKFELENSSQWKGLIIPYEEVSCFRQISAEKAMWMGSHGDNQVVVKKIDYLNGRNADTLLRELNEMAAIRHPNVVSLVGITCGSPRQLSALIEFMDNGTVRSVLADKKIDLSLNQRVAMATDIASALCYLHEDPIGMKPSNANPHVYGDLRSEKVLVNSDLVCKLNILLIVNHERRVQERQMGLNITSFGTGRTAWQAPEVLCGERPTIKSDIYSFGIIMCELSTRTLPFADLIKAKGSAATDLLIHQRVVDRSINARPTPANEFPIFFKKMMIECWHPEPERRPSAQLVLNSLQSYQEELKES